MKVAPPCTCSVTLLVVADNKLCIFVLFPLNASELLLTLMSAANVFGFTCSTLRKCKSSR